MAHEQNIEHTLSLLLGRLVTCEACSGTGEIKGWFANSNCEACDGSGWIQARFPAQTQMGWKGCASCCILVLVEE